MAFAEWLSITYGDQGVRVSCLCPQGVNTDMLRGSDELGGGASVVRSAGDVLEPEAVADVVADAIAEALKAIDEDGTLAAAVTVVGTLLHVPEGITWAVAWTAGFALRGAAIRFRLALPAYREP